MTTEHFMTSYTYQICTNIIVNTKYNSKSHISVYMTSENVMVKYIGSLETYFLAWSLRG